MDRAIEIVAIAERWIVWEEDLAPRQKIAGGAALLVERGALEETQMAHRVAWPITAAHDELAPDLAVPQSWRDRVARDFGREGPVSMSDGALPAFRAWESGFDPADEVDRAIRATRAEAFPLLGLDVHHD